MFPLRHLLRILMQSFPFLVELLPPFFNAFLFLLVDLFAAFQLVFSVLELALLLATDLLHQTRDAPRALLDLLRELIHLDLLLQLFLEDLVLVFEEALHLLEVGLPLDFPLVQVDLVEGVDLFLLQLDRFVHLLDQLPLLLVEHMQLGGLPLLLLPQTVLVLHPQRVQLLRVTPLHLLVLLALVLDLLLEYLLLVHWLRDQRLL
mmetsp:Transcript_3150/g.3047  ORF Transcript_3150/g.3047 Transcript_3150/m.3047 type:complete len:204 (+) Transcript_3150:1324-1935(+)